LALEHGARWQHERGASEEAATSVRARAPSVPVAKEAPPKSTFDLDSLTPDALIRALPSVASSKPADELDLLRAASKELGCSRLGARIQRKLKAHVRTAVRRGVLAREGRMLRLASSRLPDH
jgi:hypothetical protein